MQFRERHQPIFSWIFSAKNLSINKSSRYRENMSQVELAKISGVHQNEISKIENGKRGVGEKLAKKLAKD